MTTFKEFLTISEGKIATLRNTHREAPTSSYIAADEAEESPKDMQEYLQYISKRATRYQRYLSRWNARRLESWMLRCVDGLGKFLAGVQALTPESIGVMTKPLGKLLDNANADFGNAENQNPQIEQIIHWGLIVVDRLHAFGNETPWYSKGDDKYTPSRSPASARVPF